MGEYSARPARTVCVDFDGVIHAYRRGWADGSVYDDPIPGAIDGLRALQGDFAVVVFTSRDVEQVVPWLQRYGLDVAADGNPPVVFWPHQDQILVTNRKLPAVAYLDDRAVRFTSWWKALAELMPGMPDVHPDVTLPPVSLLPAPVLDEVLRAGLLWTTYAAPPDQVDQYGDAIVAGWRSSLSLLAIVNAAYRAGLAAGGRTRQRGETADAG